MSQLFFGANDQGEMATAYHRAPACGHPDPVTLPATGLANLALMLSVTDDG